MQFVKDIADEEVTVQGNDVTRSSNSSNVRTITVSLIISPRELIMLSKCI